MARSI